MYKIFEMISVINPACTNIFSPWFDTKTWDDPLYISKIPNNSIFLSLLSLANSADPDEIPHHGLKINALFQKLIHYNHWNDFLDLVEKKLYCILYCKL